MWRSRQEQSEVQGREQVVAWQNMKCEEASAKQKRGKEGEKERKEGRREKKTKKKEREEKNI